MKSFAFATQQSLQDETVFMLTQAGFVYELKMVLIAKCAM